MGSPSVGYSMLSEGYEITSGRDGFRAQASFVTTWASAFQFHDEIMGYATAAVVGPLSFNTPWQFPGSTTARLFASSCKITPFALDGGGNPIGVALGMAPGEFWTHCRHDVTFESPTAPQSAADDPGNLNQLDSDSPIYGCEQSVRIGTRSETIPKEKVQFDGSTEHPAEDVTVFRSETNITAHYAFIPFLPWKKFRPFVGKVNDTAIFDCDRGELLVQGVQIEPAQGPQGKIGKSLTIEMLVNEDGWNKAARGTGGTPATVETTAGDPLYAYVEFRNMFLS